MDWFSRLARAQSRQANAVSSRDVLSIATLGGARALGMEDVLGTLEVGKEASFLAVNPESINLRGTRDIHAAIVHRAGPQDITLVLSQGLDVSARRAK